MIHLPTGTKIWIAAGVTDMRRGFDGLSAQVQTVLQQQPFSGHVLCSVAAMLRQYNNAQGRWMSPDPYDGSYNPTNPQSFNRYGYVFNNPVSYLDSSGLDCDATTGVGCGDDDSDDQTIYVINGVAFGPGTCSMSDMSCQISISTYYLTNNSYFAPANLGSMHAPNSGIKPPPSCGKAWGKAIAGTLLDATGLIPGEGTIASGIKIAGSVGGVALAASGSIQDAAAGGVFTGVGMYADSTRQEFQTLGKDVAEGIPVLGTVVSGVAVLWDLGSGAQSIYNCYHGVTE